MPRPKTCKICKEKFDPQRPLQMVCGPMCAYEYQKKQKDKAWQKEKKERKEKLMTREDYFQKALKAFNWFIRERDRNKPCISCDAPAGTYRITSGHYYPQGTYRNIALDEENAHGQCWYNCNKNKHGNLQEYRIRLERRIGKEALADLDLRRNGTTKYNIPELKEIAEHYNKEARRIIKERESNASSEKK